MRPVSGWNTIAARSAGGGVAAGVGSVDGGAAVRAGRSGAAAATRASTSAPASHCTTRGLRPKPVDQGWQLTAWQMYDTTPEVRFFANWVANAMSGALLFAGRRGEDGSPVRASIQLLEELTLLNAAVAAIARSRLTGRGVLIIIPKGTRFPSTPVQGTAEDG
ncbi:hypothetical protein ACFWOJ_30930 [Streptomyces sp. NPDC058439]|uniref:hypothetical protein n=1 Tax=Streptomyces sp. NPDC058439 TaxID=3346500 RepID=UPI003652AA0D